MAGESPVSRRSVIAAAAVPFSAVRGSAANSAVTVGLIGSGGRGTFDANLLVKNTDARLTALCDLFDDRLERARKVIPVENPKIYKDYQQLLASDVDAVIIATPVFLHPEHLEAAIKAGKHVYIEKPAGVDVEGCKRVMRAADGADRKLNISFGFQQRYGPGYRKAHQLVSSGGIGTLHMAHAHFIKRGLSADQQPLARPSNEMERIRNWKHWQDSYGDFVVETYCHSIDVLNWFLGGHPQSAYAIGSRTVIRRGDQRDHTTATFAYAGGVHATLTGSQIAPAFHRDVQERFYGAGAVVETAREYWKCFRSSTNVLHEKEPQEITINALQEFVKRIREGTPENTGVRSAESTLTAIMARMSMDLKREVTWKEVMAGG